MDGSLEFDLGQKWAKGLRIRFHNAQESAEFRKSPDFANNCALKQVHDKKLVNWSPTTPPSVYAQTEADGFIARGDAFKNSQKKLIVRSADCAPLFFVDRESECAAAIHAGWRGLAKEIYKVPFHEGFNPKTTWIWCGPCLNGESFEVGEDMWSQFPKDLQRNPEIFADKGESGKMPSAGKKFFYAWNFLQSEFKKLGVELFYNVEVDTFTDEEYNSSRRWKKNGNTTPLPHNYSWISFIK